MTSRSVLNKAMFVDEVDIVVIGGRGGDGCVSFRREKFVPHGGPDGGDGGHGGSVYVQADESFNTLQHLAGKHHWRARDGGHGEGKNKHGRNGRDVIVLVPPGTIVRDAEHGLLLKDLAAPGQSICVAAGGKGGRGNTHFKSATHQAPRQAETGPARPAAHAAPGTQAHRRRRADRQAQRRQEHAAQPPLGRPAQDRRLPVHHAQPFLGSWRPAATGGSSWPTSPA